MRSLSVGEAPEFDDRGVDLVDGRCCEGDERMLVPVVEVVRGVAGDEEESEGVERADDVEIDEDGDAVSSSTEPITGTIPMVEFSLNREAAFDATGESATRRGE